MNKERIPKKVLNIYPTERPISYWKQKVTKDDNQKEEKTRLELMKAIITKTDTNGEV
jgi:hypothetical protein